MHDRLAGAYDTLTSRYDLERRLDILAGDFLANLDVKGLLALDAGAGTGWGSLRLKQAGAFVVSMDISLNMVQISRDRCDTAGVVGDISCCPYADGMFDLVFSSEVIEHTPDPLRAFAELYRVLKPTGRLVLSTPNKAWLGAVRLATRLGIRPDFGAERFLWPHQLSAHAKKLGGKVVQHRGVHLAPFQIRMLQPLLKKMDRYGEMLLPLMINQCILIEKPSLNERT